jgi:hypothetical protein
MSSLNHRNENLQVRCSSNLSPFGSGITPIRAKNHNQFNERGIHRSLETQLISNMCAVEKPLRHKGFGAGEGNRTLVCSLGSCRSAIELRPLIIQ